MENVISQPNVPGDEVVIRKSVSYHPTVWGDYFILQAQSSPSTQECDERMQERAAELMEQVRSMFKDTTDILQTMDLVDSIQLLGLSYHFEKEISEALNRVHDADFNDHGLYNTALRFRLLRQQGYHVTPDVFNKFKDEGGSFMSTLGSDVKGLLSLYNAAYLGTHGEIILDEAISFTRNYLVSALADLKPPLTTQVSLDLETPLCRRMRRLLARDYISIYQEDATRVDAILELAKLDFNLLQSLHREELKNITKWWNDLVSSKNLSFARDRLVECYFWILGIYFEPDYSRARVITTKVIALVSILDDIYDVYSTLEESQRLTEEIQSPGKLKPILSMENRNLCLTVVQSNLQVADDELMVRKSVSYRPRVGADYFIQHGQSVTPTSECDTRIKERAAELMEQTRSMSKDPTDILQTMNLVDSIQLLVLDYHFEKEIRKLPALWLEVAIRWGPTVRPLLSLLQRRCEMEGAKVGGGD
ncbi:alpha-humulene synthase-like [Musa acuminata AAA Group]|uniref:alpha-humulene synthase-like n=1 Tax=Musa acuminata AAA Group TaxID=214697 RepID=UPI0031DF5D08